MFTISKPHWQATSALALTGMILSSVTPLTAVEPAHPLWWGDLGVTNGNPKQNKGVAQLGQVKNTANKAHYELESLLPGGVGFNVPFTIPSAPDAAWYQTQKKALNLGQLKAVAKPFYDRLNEISPAWVETQLQANGLTNTHYFEDSNGYFYPWNPATPVSENYKSAQIGQIKVVFALRFRADADSDTLNDLVELAMYGDTSGDGTATDYDGDGLSDALEVTHGTSSFETDTDHDGVSDGDEVAASTDPLSAAITSSSATTLEVFTPLN